MRIAYLSASGQLGGAERCLLDMMSGVRAAEPAWPLFLLTPDPGPLASRARDLGAQVTVLPFPRALARFGDFPPVAVSRIPVPPRRLLQLPGATWAAARYSHRLRAALDAWAPDLVHANGLKTDLLGAWARPARAALVWHVHDYISPRPLASWLFRQLGSRCDTAIAVSQSVARDVESVCHGRPPTVTVYNAVDVDDFSPTGPAADLDALCGMPPAPPGTVRVGLVATMAWWKGHEVFLRALGLLPPALALRAYIVGGPIYRTDQSQHTPAELAAVARALGVAGRVGFTGFVERPAEAMRALDIVVHASTRPEPFGLVVAEGMACGRAVVAANAGGVTEFIEPGVDVLVHRPGDAADLAQQIAVLAGDAALRVRLGEAARAASRDEFARERLTRDILAVYRRAVAAVAA